MAFDKEAAFSAALKLAEAPAPAPEAAPEAGAAPDAPPAPNPDQENSPDAESEVEPEGETPAAPAKAEPPKPADPPKPDKVTKSLEDVAREKAALRAERQALAKDKERAARAEALLAAAEKGDAMSLLTAAKIPWNAAAKQVLEGVPDKKPEPAEVTPAEKRIAALEQELNQQKAQARRSEVLGQIKDLAKSDTKFKFVAGLGAEQQALNWLENYYAQTGELPAENLSESLAVACEAVENHLSREADRWRPLLGSAAAGSPAVKQVVPPKAVSQQAAKTLTNDTGSGPKAAPVNKRVPKSQDDYIAETMKLLEETGA
jgi:hypothetical protein